MNFGSLRIRPNQPCLCC